MIETSVEQLYCSTMIGNDVSAKEPVESDHRVARNFEILLDMFHSGEKLMHSGKRISILFFESVTCSIYTPRQKASKFLFHFVNGSDGYQIDVESGITLP